MRRITRSEDKFLKESLVIGLFGAILIVNGFLSYSTLLQDRDLLSAVLLAINAGTVPVVFALFTIYRFSLDDKAFWGILRFILIATVATSFITVATLASLFSLMPGFSKNAPVALISSFCIVALFVYYFFVRDHT